MAVAPYKPGPRNGNSRHWKSDEDAFARWATILQRMPSACTAAMVTIVVTASLLLLLHPGVRYHASETAKAVMASGNPHSSSGSFMRYSHDKTGFCRLEYTVKTWDGHNARVCDPSLCVGREKLKVLHAAGSTRRWSAFHESAYMRLFNSNKINGWLQVGPEDPDGPQGQELQQQQHMLSLATYW